MLCLSQMCYRLASSINEVVDELLVFDLFSNHSNYPLFKMLYASVKIRGMTVVFCCKDK